MRSDLHNLVTAQEAFYTNGLQYYNGPVPDPVFSYTVFARRHGHAAQRDRVGLGRYCHLRGFHPYLRDLVGTGGPVAPATIEGTPKCTP